MLLGIVGKKGVGKDTCADYLCIRYGFIRRAFADPVKEVCTVAFQLSATQLEGEHKEVIDERWGISPRQMMQLVGTDMFREMVAPDFWIRRFIEFHGKHANQSIVVPDVRFQNEVDTIKRLGGYVIRLTRNGGQGRCKLDDTHKSEVGVDDLVKIDAEVDNAGTVEELWEKTFLITDAFGKTARWLV